MSRVGTAFCQGSAPAGDDVAKFLAIFSQNHHPLLVSAAAALLVVVLATVMIKKGII